MLFRSQCGQRRARPSNFPSVVGTLRFADPTNLIVDQRFKPNLAVITK